MPKKVPQPDEVRMTLGDHLEELRRRLILALIGLAIVTCFCFLYGQTVVAWFCRPLIMVLLDMGLTPQLYSTELGDGFGVFIKISMITALALASPWMAWQAWQFVAAGLYEHERRVVRRFVPLSIFLMVGGMAFVYFAVLPWTIGFFLRWTSDFPLMLPESPKINLVAPPSPTSTASAPISAPPAAAASSASPTPSLPSVVSVPRIPGDPAQANEGDLWINSVEGRLKIFHQGRPRVVQFGSERLVSPMYTLPQYISLVMTLLLLFGLSFQLPIVMVAVSVCGLILPATYGEYRRVAYLLLVVLATIITPGDFIMGSLMLTVPLIMLYESGIVLSKWNVQTDTSSV